MNTNQLPWELNSDLTADRITQVAQLLADTRYAALDGYNPAKGDGAWSQGCRSYERCKNILTEKGRSGDWPWFSVVPNASLKCKFKIGQTIVRFVKGYANELAPRTLSQAQEDVNQLSFSLGDNNNNNLFWRLVIETAHDGEVISIYCVGATVAGEIVCKWEVPLKPFIPILMIVNVLPSDAIEQQAPTVSIPSIINKNECANE